MRSDDGETVDAVVIGGGFSGTMVAAHLAQRGLGTRLIEGGGRAGRGTAFSTPEEAHLLNVPAAKMSAWPDRPSDFADAMAAEGHEPGDFVPRWRFGAYLRGILDRAGVDVVECKAVSAGRGNGDWLVGLADGSNIRATALVLAQGNQPPLPLDMAKGIPPNRFVNDPWSDLGRAAIERAAESGGDVLIVGTGLTMVDLVLSLDAAGHRGHIVALSRRGLVPRSHAAFDPVPVEGDELPTGSVSALWRWLRKRGAKVGWRAAVDSLRPHSQALWQGMGEEEQRRFLRHARPWWDVHRHRIAPDVAAVLKRLIGEGRLEIVAGRAEALEVGDRKLTATIKRRGSDKVDPRDFAVGVNATGPLGSISASEDRLIAGLFGAGLARPDALGLAIAVDARSRIAGAPCAWALGPMTKGRFWEITAVPDIRGQVAAVADDIAEELNNAVQS